MPTSVSLSTPSLPAKHESRRRHAQNLALCALSLYLMFRGFQGNTWQVAADEWFWSHQRDMESFVLGRIVATRQWGLFSYGGLTGWGNTVSCPQGGCIGTPQYEAFLEQRPLTGFTPYLSQIGGQAMLFGLLDRVLSIPPTAKLDLFHGLTSFLTALTLTLIVLWFRLEFGLAAGLFVLASIVLSQWLTVFGRNLWWSTWAFYLPMGWLAFYLRRRNARPAAPALGLVVFAALFLKTFINGYEYLTTTIVMMLMPLLYYALLGRWGFRSLMSSLLVAAAGALMAILVSGLILCLQIAMVRGSLTDGPAYLLYTLAKRTYSDPQLFPSEYRTSLRAGAVEVLLPYLRGYFFNLNNWLDIPSAFITRFVFKIRYVYLIALFFGAGGLLWRLDVRSRQARPHPGDIPLVWTAWLSILAPLSWLLIFKAHSSIHTHMNFLVWQMPYTLFGFALTGVAAQRVAAHLLARGSGLDRIKEAFCAPSATPPMDQRSHGPG